MIALLFVGYLGPQERQGRRKDETATKQVSTRIKHRREKIAAGKVDPRPIILNSISVSIVLGFRQRSLTAYSDPTLNLIFLSIVPVLIAVSTTVFFPVCLLLVAIRFSASVQLVSSNLFSCHNGGSPEEIAQEAEGGRRDSTRREKQARPADPTEMATPQAVTWTVDSK
jgi:hypothetical protein